MLLGALTSNAAVAKYHFQDSLVVSKIIIEGNGITKEKIILREFIPKSGDKIDLLEIEGLIKRSQDNLLNTSLFNFVTISHEITENNEVIFNIDLQERWYIWPYPILEHADRNFSSFIKNREWSRVDYGLYLLINNFRGRKELLKFKTIFGYNNTFVIHYKIPFIDKKQRLGIGAEWIYFRNHELPFRVSNDKLEYLKLYDRYAGKTQNFSFFLIYRPHIYTNYFLNIKYANLSLADSLFKLNTNYFFNGRDKIEYLALDYIVDHDKRDSKIYPLEGYRLHTHFHKSGVGIFSNEGIFYIRTIIEENLKLSDKFYINTGVEGKWGVGNENSFYFNKAIGYENYIRGMEFYASNGTAYYITKSNLKYEVLPQKEFNLKFIPSDKFSKGHYALYFNLFFDTGYVKSRMDINNNITNEFLYGGGVGIDLVTYYDKILRIEYSLNKFGEHGLFLHIGAPIIDN